MTEKRKTSISWVEAEKITVRGYPIENLIGNAGFGKAIYLLLLGEMPTDEQAKMLDAVLVSVIDHGVRPPSTIAAVTAANTGANLNAAAAAGLLAINKYHGGAVEDAMSAIGESVAIGDDKGVSAFEAAGELVVNYKLRNKRVSGFGHRFHGADPRTGRLFELANELGIAGRFVEHATQIERVLSENSSRKLPINADGAIAAILCELDFPPKIANGIFMIARLPGLIAHIVEEQERNPPMRTVNVDEYEYDGRMHD